MAHRYNRGEVVHLYYYNYAWGTDTLVDCDTGYPTITLTDSKEAVILNAQVMSNCGTGTYSWDYSLLAAAEFGWWNEKYIAITDSLTTITHDGFKLE